MCVCVCVCVHINGELIDFGESDMIINIWWKVDKWNTYNWFRRNIYFFIQEKPFSVNFFFLTFSTF